MAGLGNNEAICPNDGPSHFIAFRDESRTIPESQANHCICSCSLVAANRCAIKNLFGHPVHRGGIIGSAVPVLLLLKHGINQIDCTSAVVSGFRRRKKDKVQRGKDKQNSEINYSQFVSMHTPTQHSTINEYLLAPTRSQLVRHVPRGIKSAN